jgi:acyl-CoA synthetase (AMP-forming)/AMP-acid ligase II
MHLVPPLVLFLASHPGVRPKHLQSLRYIEFGAAPMGRLDVERFLKRAPPSISMLQGNTCQSSKIKELSITAFWDIALCV